MRKYGSILDYRQKELTPELWIDNKLKSSVKQFIVDSVLDFFEEIDIPELGVAIESIYIGSSLATYYYTSTSDLDVKVIIDCFELDFNPFKTEDELMEYLVDKGRKSIFTTRMIPGTNHPMDFYFYSTTEFYPITLIKYDSLYDVILGDWLKEPEEPLASLAPGVILEKAKDKAAPYLNKLTVDIAKTKRDVVDFNILKDYLKSLDIDDLDLVRKEFSSALEKITTSVQQLITDKEVIKQLRKKAFKKEELQSDLEFLLGSLNYSDGNLIFKVLQRYGYMKILASVEDLYEQKGVKPSTIDELEDTLDGTNSST